MQSVRLLSPRRMFAVALTEDRKFWHWCLSNTSPILFSISNIKLVNQQACAAQRRRILIMFSCDAAGAKHRKHAGEAKENSLRLHHQSKCVKCPRIGNGFKWSGAVGLSRRELAGNQVAALRELRLSQSLWQRVTFLNDVLELKKKNAFNVDWKWCNLRAWSSQFSWWKKHQDRKRV